MKSIMGGTVRSRAAAVVVLVVSVAALWVQVDAGSDAAQAGVRVRLWDTVTPIQPRGGLASRERWRPVAAGAPLRLQGDLVVETDALATAFASRLGRVLIYATAETAQSRAQVLPVGLQRQATRLVVTHITQQPTGTVTVEADFRASQSGSFPIAIAFTDNRILGISPQGNTRGVSVVASIEAALVPSFVGDDLIFEARDYPSATTLSLPPEHMLLALLNGEGSMLVMTWQDEGAFLQLALSGSGPANASIRAASLTGARSLSLAVLDAPGIWHREQLQASFLEQDVAIHWRPPFPAIWLTQLYEDEVKTTYEFREAKEEMWRGGVGDYTYPAWFSGGKTMLSLGKKIVPEGEALIYFLERNEETPPQVESPIDIAQRTLAGDVLAGVLDIEGRETWEPERPNPVIGAATCAVTDALKAIFDAGQEVEKQATVRGGVEDMYFYLTAMFERDARFYPFAQDMIAYLDAREKANPRLAPFLREVRSTAAEMVTTYDNARDTIRDMDYAHELGARTIALAAERRPDNPQQMAELKQEWTGMGGALEALARREHTLARKLYQQAGYGAAPRPEVMPLAEEIRRRTRQCLERPEGYEIWANY